MAEDLLSGISRLLEDPEASKKVRELAGGFGVGGSSEEYAPTSGSADTDQISRLLGGLKMQSSREVVLLRAIEPYMRPSRAEKIRSAIKAIQVIGILNALQGNGGGGL